MVEDQGRKNDAEKLRMELVPVSAIKALAEILTKGAKKYGDNNWRNGLLWSRPYAAVLRHLLAWWGGETNDKESGNSHLWHAMCELAFLVEYESTHKELDDRPKHSDPPGTVYEVNDPKLVWRTVPQPNNSLGPEVRQEGTNSRTQDIAFRKQSQGVFQWVKDFGSRG